MALLEECKAGWRGRILPFFSTMSKAGEVARGPRQRSSHENFVSIDQLCAAVLNDWSALFRPIKHAEPSWQLLFVLSRLEVPSFLHMAAVWPIRHTGRKPHHRRQLAEGAGVRDHLLAPPHRHRRRLVRLGLCLLRQQALPGHLHQDHPPQRGLRVGEVLGLRSPPCISACAHTYLPCVETPSCFADK